ncbi:MAG: hypothetical protein GY769_05830 [bacterium]|nr:hypothetical protein [bacterium]
MRRKRLCAAGTAVGLCFGALLAGAAAQDEGEKGGSFSERIAVTAVDLFILVRDQGGGLPADLGPDDFEVLEDGVIQPVIGVESASQAPATEAHSGAPPAAKEGARKRDWHTVIYFDQALCGRRAVKIAALNLAEQAGRLADLGLVEVTLAEESVTILQAATRDAGAVRTALARVAKKVRGQSQVAGVRRRYLRTIADQEAISSQRSPGGVGGSTAPAGRPGSVESLARRQAARQTDEGGRQLQIRSALLQERAIIQARRDLLLSHLARYRAKSPRALILVSDGYDVDPRDFYLAGVEERLESRLSPELQELAFGSLTEEMARVLVGSNWTIVGVALGELGAGMAAPASESGTSVVQDAGSGQRTSSLGAARFLMSRPLEPLLQLARDSGGELLTSEKELENAVTNLADRIRLTYQASRLPDGRIHRLQVRAKRPGLKIQAPRWVGSETPEEVVLNRAQLIAQGRRLGDLELESMVLFDSAETEDRGATLAARLHLAPLDAVRRSLDGAALRVTTAIYFPERVPFVHHEVVWEQDLREGAHWGHSAHVTLPPDTGAVVVVVEELTTGSWGGSVAPLVRPQKKPP